MDLFNLYQINPMEIGQEMYSELLLDLYRHPLNKKQLADFDINSVEFNPLCGDKVELFLKFDASDRLEAIGYQGEGCAISQAATSLLTEHVKGKTKQEIQALTGETLLDLLGLKNLNPTRMRCALLGLAAVQKALKIQK
jgi:nitrogen fixation NifU-like protein